VVPSGSAIWEMYEDKIHGFAVEANNVESYVEAISKFQDPKVSLRMGHQAWNKSKEHNWNQHGRKLGKLLD